MRFKWMTMLVAVAVVFALGVVGVASASAAPQWGKCVVKEGGEYGNGTCTEGASRRKGGMYEFDAFSSAKAVSSQFNGVLLEDKGNFAMECSGREEGYVGGGSAGEITEFNFTECNVLASGKCLEAHSSPVVSAQGLPWVTELVEVTNSKGEKEDREKIKKHSGGVEPGWEIGCETLGIYRGSDDCAGEMSAKVSNVSTGVNTIFDSVTAEHPLSCSLSKEAGGRTGLVSGTVNVLNPSGIQLAVK